MPELSTFPMVKTAARACVAVEVQAMFGRQSIDVRRMEVAPVGRRRRQQPRYLIGGGAGAHAPAGDGGGENHVLVQAGDGGFEVQVARGMTGEVSVAGEPVTLNQWVDRHGPSFPCPSGGRVRLCRGRMSFVVSDVGHEPAAAGLTPGWLSGWRWREQKYTAATGLMLALVVLASALVPPDARALSFSRWAPDTRFLAFRLIPPELPPSPAAGAGATGAAAPGGTRGASAARPAPRKRPPSIVGRSPARVPSAPSDLQRSSDRRAEIRSAGVLGIFAPGSGSPLDQLLDAGSVSSVEQTRILGGIVHGPGPDGQDAGGVVMGGTGAGHGPGTVGGGGFATIGAGGPGSVGRDYGRYQASLRGRRTTMTPQIMPGQPTVRGSLDKEIVRRIVRRHINEVRFCYEKELARNSGLAGRVAINFTIAPDGRVAAALVQSSTLGNVRAELCLVEAVRRWAFPQPAGGGLVIATYPFNFVAAGAGP